MVPTGVKNAADAAVTAVVPAVIDFPFWGIRVGTAATAGLQTRSSYAAAARFVCTSAAGAREDSVEGTESEPPPRLRTAMLRALVANAAIAARTRIGADVAPPSIQSRPGGEKRQHDCAQMGSK